MALWLNPTQYVTVEAAVDRLVPPDAAGAPGAKAGGVADYIDGLLGAFTVDPPLIWAGGPFSGRHGGDGSFEEFAPLGPIEELAWRTRIEGSRGIAEREWNGPVVGLQEQYRQGLDRLGHDFAERPADEQVALLDADSDFERLLYIHACEGLYGDPVYGGNRGGVGWQSIGFGGDAQPRGWTDVEVSGRD